MTHSIRTTLLFTGMLMALTSCKSLTTLPATESSQALDARRYQLTVTAHDGTELSVTLWQPALKAEQYAPLVLHTHGFGLQRMDGRIGLYENLIPSGQIAKALWKQGHWLLTWDQRGHGDSGGKINVMDPTKEVRDVTTLLDWAEDNISRLARDEKGEIRVGMVGESYGGGVQLLAATRDSRIDAIVPMTTWYDISDSLAPADVPKSGWIRMLYLMGDWVNFRKLAPDLREGFELAMAGEISKEVKEEYGTHGLSAECDTSMPKVDALVIQGFRDVLFPMDQGIASADCLAKGGGNVHLIAQSGGHLLPLEQHSPSLPVWYVDSTLQCGDQQFDTETLAADWLTSRLSGQPGPSLPAICVSMNGKWGMALQEWPSQYESIDLKPVTLSGKHSGSLRWLTRIRDWLAGWQREHTLSEDFSHSRDGERRPAFIPLHTAAGDEHRVGTPQLTLTADLAEGTPVLAGLVVRRAGKARLKLVNDQLTAVRVGQRFNLPPMALALNPGDQLGLALFSTHPQFNALEMDFGSGAVFSGQLDLPMAQDNLTGIATLRQPQK